MSRFHHNFLRNTTEENKILYNRQRDYCVSLLQKSKTAYYENLNIRNVTDNKLFWKSVKPLLKADDTGMGGEGEGAGGHAPLHFFAWRKENRETKGKKERISK